MSGRVDIAAENRALRKQRTMLRDALLAARPIVDAAFDRDDALCRSSPHEATLRAVDEALAATTDDELATWAREEAEERAAWEALTAKLADAERDRDFYDKKWGACVDELREARLALMNERGEGEPPSEGWRVSLRGHIVRWVRLDARPGRTLDVYPRLNDARTAMEWHWWDREVDRDGEVIAEHAEGAAPTAREAMRAADNALTTPTPGADRE